MLTGWLKNISTHRRLAFIVLLLSLFSHGLIICAVVYKWNSIDLRFLVEYITCLVLSAALNMATFAVPRVLQFRILHGIRFLVILVSVAILGGSSIEIPVLLLFPFVAETVIYDHKYIALCVNGACVLLIGIVLSVQLAGTGAFSAMVSVAVFITLAGFAAGFSWFAILYRETLVDSNLQIRNLHTTVMNLSNANVAFQAYANDIEMESADKERSRITRELHDTVGYTLTNVFVMMNAAKVLLKTDPDSLPDLFDRMGEQSESALNETRQILYRLRNFKSHRPVGIKAVSQLTESFSGATGINVLLSTGNIPWSLGQRLDAVVMRFVQEGLTNSFRHGKATRVHIRLWRTADEIRLCVRDNGQGVADDTQIRDGIGLAGMKERFHDLGGMVYHNNVEDGFELRATIPYGTGGILGEN